MNDQGLTLPELLLVVAVLGVLASLGCISGAETLARQRLETASRTLSQGIEQARSSALRNGAPCGMSLRANGWEPAADGVLPGCQNAARPWEDAGFGAGGLQVVHNMPAELRFSSNGLVLDGGTVVLTMRGTTLRRCLVMALPLGVVRVGRYGGDPAAAPESDACLPYPSL